MQKIDRTGETNIANNGQKMTIIKYRRNNDIDVQFEDGTIVKHKQYTNFKKGTIQNPNFNKKNNRKGETNITNNGQVMTIIEYRRSDDIDIQFEDGIIVKHKSYDNFKKGNIKNPNYNNELILKNNRKHETNIANNGQKMIIIEYRNCNDIDIEFEDGTVVKHKIYSCFRKGEIKNPNLQIKNRRNKTLINNDGQKMTIIKYRKYNDINIEFEDGTIVKHRSYGDFKKGQIKNPNYIISGISYNELFCLKQLEQFGFKKSEKGKLKHLGLGKLELDLYNPELKIAIEYDGGIYNKNQKYHFIEKDIKKDLLCEQVGITLYRIREPQLPKYNSSSIKFYLEDKSQGSQNLINILKLIIKDINERFNTEFSYKYKKQEIKIGSIYQNRKGETNIANNGQIMTIIEYRRYSDIDVQFKDNTIVKHKTYDCFKKGNIKNPNSSIRIDKRIKNRKGETKINKKGQKMIIIEYRKCSDIDIQFEDNTIIKHKSYNNFKKGSIQNPNSIKRKQVKRKKI